MILPIIDAPIIASRVSLVDCVQRFDNIGGRVIVTLPRSPTTHGAQLPPQQPNEPPLVTKARRLVALADELTDIYQEIFEIADAISADAKANLGALAAVGTTPKKRRQRSPPPPAPAPAAHNAIVLPAALYEVAMRVPIGQQTPFKAIAADLVRGKDPKAADNALRQSVHKLLEMRVLTRVRRGLYTRSVDIVRK